MRMSRTCGAGGSARLGAGPGAVSGGAAWGPAYPLEVGMFFAEMAIFGAKKPSAPGDVR